jgi:hypothetical protein
MRRSVLRRATMLAASAALATGLMAGFGSVASASPASPATSVTEAAWGNHDKDDDDDFFIDFFAIFGPAGGIIIAS